MFNGFCQSMSQPQPLFFGYHVYPQAPVYEAVYADLSKLSWIDAVARETLRLHATAPLGTARCSESLNTTWTAAQFRANEVLVPVVALAVYSGSSCLQEVLLYHIYDT